MSALVTPIHEVDGREDVRHRAAAGVLPAPFDRVNSPISRFEQKRKMIDPASITARQRGASLCALAWVRSWTST
jgi:hypothetical protein